MLEADWLVECLHGQGVRFYTGVPDSVLKALSAALDRNAADRMHLIAANEGTAVGLAIGHHLATGGLPLVYLQNAGLGNAVNPLLSLAHPRVYGIPLLLLIGWRGEPGRPDEPQHRVQGELTVPLLQVMKIPHCLLPGEPAAAAAAVDTMAGCARRSSGPSALVVAPDILRGPAPRPAGRLLPMTREQAIAGILAAADPRDAIVASTGMIGRELVELRNLAGGGGDGDFLTVGGMGHASQIALALALECPDRAVYCLDGDGAALMHLGGWVTIGRSGARNLHHIVLNNGVHDSVGGQPTGAFDIDFPAIARACGYSQARRVQTLDALTAALATREAHCGPDLLEVQVCAGHRADLGRPAVAPETRRAQFRRWIDQSG